MITQLNKNEHIIGNIWKGRTQCNDAIYVDWEGEPNVTLAIYVDWEGEPNVTMQYM